jgi:hypothetical protein
MRFGVIENKFNIIKGINIVYIAAIATTTTSNNNINNNLENDIYFQFQR